MRQAVGVLETTWAVLRRRARAENGQDLLEYGLLAALISMFLIAAVTNLGRAITDSFWELIARGFPSA